MRIRGTQALLTLGATLACMLFTGCGGTAPVNDAGDSPTPGAVGSDVLRDASGAPSGVSVFWPYVPDALVAGYHVYHNDEPIPDSARGDSSLWAEVHGSPLIAVPGGSPEFVRVDLLFPIAIGETWYFRVAAVDAGGSESYLSAEVSVAIATHVVTAIDPTSAAVSFNVGISGERFGVYDTQTDRVFFPGVQWQGGIGFVPAQLAGTIANWYHQEPAHITAVVPLGATTGQLDVNVDGVSALSPQVFTNSDPYLTDIAPLFGSPRGFVTLRGANFGDAFDATHGVVLGGTQLTGVNDYGSYSDTEIVFVIPGLKPGDYPVTVRVGDTDSNQGWLSVDPSLGQVWAHTWGNVGDDVATGIVADTDGNVFVCGFSESYSTEPEDVLLMRYTPGGQLQWGRYWNNTNITPGFRDDLGMDVAIDANDDLYITGYTQNSSGTNTMLLLKYRNTGQLEYGRTWESAAGEQVAGQALACDGTNVYIAATIAAGADSDLLLLRYNLDGTFDGASRSTIASDQQPTDIVIDGAGDLVVVGNTVDAFGLSGGDMFVAKYDTAFNVLWSNYWGDINADEVALGVSIHPDNNNVLVSGGTQRLPPAVEIPVLLVFESTGVLLSDDLWTVTGGARFYNVYPASTGHLLAVGSRGPADDELMVLVLDTDLTTLFSSRYSSAATYPVGLACGLDRDENLLICGTDASLGGSWNDESMLRDEFIGDSQGIVEAVFAAPGTSQAIDGLDRPAVGTVDTGGGVIDTLAIKFDPE